MKLRMFTLLVLTFSQLVMALPNPAAVYCIEQSQGRYEIVSTSRGESGICIFTDGSQCGDMAHFRGECLPGTCAVWSAENNACEPVITR